MWMVALLFFIPMWRSSPAPFTGRRTYSASRAPFAGATTLDATGRGAIRRALHGINWALGGPHGHAHDTPIADARHRSVDGLS